MSPAEDLPDEWRTKAAEFRDLALESLARAYEDCASDLELTLRLYDDEPLTLAEAAEVSGYSVDHLGRLVRDGKIPNVGRPGAPRVRRRDLPIKPKRRVPVAPETPRAHRSNRQVVQSIINGER